MTFHDEPRDRWDERDRWDDDPRSNPWDQLRDPAVEARSAVLGPAVVLLVLAVFNLLGGLVPLGYGLVIQSLDSGEYEEMFNLEPDEPLDPEDPEAPPVEESVAPPTYNGWTAEQLQTITAWVLIGTGFGSLLAAVILALGGLMMLRLKCYWLTILAAITAIVSPGGCLILGLLGGLWAIITLVNTDVRKAFT